jgi:hypothetical protein
MIQGTLNGQDTNRLYIEVCKLAVCQWKLQMKVLLEMNEEHIPDTSSKRAVLTDDTNGKESASTSNETGDPSGKRWKSVFYDRGGTAVPGKCRQCNADFLGPPNCRGGADSTKTWFKICRVCNVLQRKKTSGSLNTRRTQQVDISLTEDGPSGYKDVQSEVTSDCDPADHIFNYLDDQTESTSEREPLMTYAIVDVATAFPRSDKFKKDEFLPPLGSDDSDDDLDNETLDRKEGLDDNLTSHDSLINPHQGREADEDLESTTPRFVNEQGSNTNRSSMYEIIQEKYHQERKMMLDELRSLNKEQIATFNAIKLTNESMKSLVEQHVKTSSRIETS